MATTNELEAAAIDRLFNLEDDAYLRQDRGALFLVQGSGNWVEELDCQKDEHLIRLLLERTSPLRNPVHDDYVDTLIAEFRQKKVGDLSLELGAE